MGLQQTWKHLLKEWFGENDVYLGASVTYNTCQVTQSGYSKAESICSRSDSKKILSSEYDSFFF